MYFIIFVRLKWLFANSFWTFTDETFTPPNYSYFYKTSLLFFCFVFACSYSDTSFGHLFKFLSASISDCVKHCRTYRNICWVIFSRWFPDCGRIISSCNSSNVYFCRIHHIVQQHFLIVTYLCSWSVIEICGKACGGIKRSYCVICKRVWSDMYLQWMCKDFQSHILFYISFIKMSPAMWCYTYYSKSYHWDNRGCTCWFW